MLSLDDSSLRVLDRTLGTRILNISAPRLDVSEDEIRVLDRELIIHFDNRSNLEIKSSFFENKDGEVFHDYEFRKGVVYTGEYSVHEISSQPIVNVQVIGREFPLNSFKKYNDIHNKYLGVEFVDNIIVFVCSDKRKISIVLDDYFPSINIYLQESSLNTFINNSSSKYYKMHTE